MPHLRYINDPIYGFVTIPEGIIYELIQHPYFQRLRRIRQLGMTHWVYPGAQHTRFQHALGAMHLMRQAIDTLRLKDHQISKEEEEGVIMAILLHDIGHGPFSHALEDTIVSETKHEVLSELMMDKLNRHFDGRLAVAISIFRNQYPKKFLHQLVSGQLDMDSMDYLNRDSFFCDVTEGVVSNDRIIKMLEVHNDELALEVKGIYSIEKFILARRLMYWQVYLHKTVVSAECLLIRILRRAKEISRHGEELFSTPSFKVFLKADFSKNDFQKSDSLLDSFSQLDDSDISASVKVWAEHSDPVLSNLCRRMVTRNLYKIKIQKAAFNNEEIAIMQDRAKEKLGIENSVMDYFVFTGKLVNNAYSRSDKINIIYKDGSVKDIAEAADTLSIEAMSETVEKYYICFPKELL